MKATGMETAAVNHPAVAQVAAEAEVRRRMGNKPQNKQGRRVTAL